MMTLQYYVYKYLILYKFARQRHQKLLFNYPEWGTKQDNLIYAPDAREPKLFPVETGATLIS